MNRLVEADRRLYLLIHCSLRRHTLDTAMVWLSGAGTKGAIWFIIAIVLALVPVPHGWQSALLSIAALVLTEGTINIVLKPLVRRRRPYQSLVGQQLLVRTPGPHSWPSAHAGSSFGAALVLAYIYPRLAPFVLVLAFLITYSRVYVGVHYPSDVLAGAATGLAWGTLALVVGYSTGFV